MGTCISKCSSAKEEDSNAIQDKLVIAQAPIPTFPLSKDSLPKNPFSLPLSSSSSPTATICTSTTSTNTINTTTGSSFSSYSSCSSSTSTSSCSSSTSCIPKDRSFSNEFLWSCIKENPQITRADQVGNSPTKKKPSKSPTPRAQNQRSKTIAATTKQSIPGSNTPSKPPKKANEISPSLARQKSFRKEHEGQKHISVSKKNVGSQSPIRRFNVKAVDVLGSPQEADCKRTVACRGLSPSPSRRFTGVAGRDILRNPQDENRKCGKTCGGPSPNPSRRFDRDAIRRGLSSSPSRKFNGDVGNIAVGLMGNDNFPVAVETEKVSSMNPCHGPHLQKRETLMNSSHPQVDEIVLGEILSKHDSNSLLSVEDIDNPLISLDCFIFL